MNKFILSMAFGALMCGAGMAQTRKMPERTPEGRSKQMTERMTKQLSLSPEEVAKVQPINAEFAQQMMAFRQQRKAGQAAPEESRKAMKAFGDKRQEELKQVLTPEHYNKWMQLREDRMDRRTEMHDVKPTETPK